MQQTFDAVIPGVRSSQPEDGGGNEQPADAAASGGSFEDMSAAYFKYVEGFAAMLDNMNAAVKREKLDIAAQYLALKAERQRFEQESLRVQQVFNGAEQVTLNVGGHKYTTTITTLKNAPSPSLFSAMFSGRHQLMTDKEGCYFIDRDGRHFHDILNYLRDGDFKFPFAVSPDASSTMPLEQCKYLIELRAEAEFFGLSGLVAKLDRYPWGVVKVQRTTWLNTDETWVYEEGQLDEIVMSVDKPCQLVGVGLCGTDTYYNIELKVLEVAAEDYDAEIEELHEQSQTVTKELGQMVDMLLLKPVMLQPHHMYMLSGLIKGSDSFCCEECMETVHAAGVKVQFHQHDSPNGTTTERGQFPALLLRVLHAD